MPWPLASQFSALLQRPAIAFKDERLRGCTIERNEQGQPRPWSGAFAVVYKGTYQDGQPTAIRVFTSESSERRERYMLSSSYLRLHRLKCLVNFEYRDDSIRCSDGKWYPLILMDWVDGETLFKWTRKKCLENNGAALAAAAGCWIALIRELEENNVAHGDLQHANIIVTPDGRLKLVDYDCMCVPALFGRRNLEIGVEPYQHPQRNENTVLSPVLDRYSSIVIYLALRALSVDPSLWIRYVEQLHNDKILFRKSDFQFPQQSPLVQELLRSPDETVRETAGELFYKIAPGPIESVPALEELVNDYKDVEKLLKAGEFEQAVELLNQRGKFTDAPEYMKPAIQNAYEQVCKRKAILSWGQVPRVQNEAVDRRLCVLGQTLLTNAVDGTAPLPPEEMNRLFEARKRVQILDRIANFTQSEVTQRANLSLSTERVLIQLGGQLPPQYPFTQKTRIDTAKVRVQALDHLINVVNKTPDDEKGIHRANKAVIKIQCESLMPRELRPRIELAEHRYKYVKKVLAIPSDLPLDEYDARILDAWNDNRLKDCKQVAPWRPKYETAKRRRVLLEKLSEAIRTDNQELIVELVKDPLLEKYPLPEQWKKYVGQAKDIVEVGSVMEQALDSSDPQEFLRLFDARQFREYPDQYANYKNKILKWTYDYICLNETNGLKPTLGRAGLIMFDKSEGTYQLRWTWPHPRFTDKCLIGVTKTPVRDIDRPDEIHLEQQIVLDRKSWEEGGGRYLYTQTPEMSECYVTVWAVIDIGFTVYYSEPLPLGRLEKRSRGWNFFGRRSSGPATAEAPESESD